jgi:hypothetical protein
VWHSVTGMDELQAQAEEHNTRELWTEAYTRLDGAYSLLCLAQGTLDRLAVENHALALSMWDYVFPPWRWRQWSRLNKQVKAGLAETTRRRVERFRTLAEDKLA